MTIFSIIVVIVGIWTLCGYFAYGYSLAHWQRKYPYVAKMKGEHEEDKKFSLFWSTGGPITLLLTFFMGGHKYGRLYPWENNNEIK